MTEIKQVSVTIASGGTTSTALDLDGHTLCGISLPTMTGTAMTFTVDNGSGTYQTMVDGAGNNVSKTIASSKYVKFDPLDFLGIGKIKLVSGSTEGGARSIVCHLAKEK